MIHIKYKVKESSHHGIGFFADQDIKKGDFIYTPNPLLDVNLNQDDFDSLSPEEQKEVLYYGYFDKKSQKYHVAFEMIRILNHDDSQGANVTQNENMIMSAKDDILQGEELLQDYNEIYSEDSLHFNRILTK